MKPTEIQWSAWIQSEQSLMKAAVEPTGCWPFIQPTTSMVSNWSIPDGWCRPIFWATTFHQQVAPRSGFEVNIFKCILHMLSKTWSKFFTVRWKSEKLSGRGWSRKGNWITRCGSSTLTPLCSYNFLQGSSAFLPVNQPLVPGNYFCLHICSI